ncbi:Eukaryotic translation initiation factor 3 subunit I [Venturia nashicola]|uniref:Eukaryotic translation initiation factor 3 subunit I n=1 Tax=Venturia nashicola TaxID=86259 RepID=A0A4Z1P123_9PEZI|nr:Eukaryotic translation initiation factor 3 subunit I [Venturia nashicola]TLD32574.1 Eukaryotic translation initiation factor 3 subunit I [Venturia nashicola]
MRFFASISIITTLGTLTIATPLPNPQTFIVPPEQLAPAPAPPAVPGPPSQLPPYPPYPPYPPQSAPYPSQPYPNIPQGVPPAQPQGPNWSSPAQPNKPNTITLGPTPKNQPQLAPNNPPSPKGKDTKDKPYIENDASGFTMHGPLGTYHKGPDGFYLNGGLGTIDAQKGAPTYVQSGLGTIQSGPGGVKYDPKNTNKKGGSYTETA